MLIVRFGQRVCYIFTDAVSAQLLAQSHDDKTRHLGKCRIGMVWNEQEANSDSFTLISALISPSPAKSYLRS